MPRGGASSAARNRALFVNFFRRELTTRYLGSVTGFAWALLNPLALLAVYAFVFTHIFKATSFAGQSFIAFVAVALWPWLAAQEALQRGTLCLAGYSGMIRKVAFPHEIVVLASVAATLALQFVGYVAVLAALRLTGEPIHLAGLIVAVPVWLILAVAVVGVTFALAALQVFVRDVEHVLMPILMIVMYLTPILYPLSLVPANLRWLVAANPFNWVVTRLREALLDGRVDVPAGGRGRAGRRLAALRRRAFRILASVAAFRRLPMTATPGSLMRLSHVGKDYAKVETRGGRLRLVYDLLRGRGAAHVFRAVDDVSLSLSRGESLGIIGENGAGKSTLLKIVAGVIEPTRGEVSVNGRVGALLELGAGFHPEYSGLANIDLAAALLGLAPREIAAKRAEIVAFADLGEHIRDPIKQYSSGMVVRLGFAVATALAPEILITDEVLAVGDESFQKRCIAWIERFLAGGGTLLLCSHSMYHIQKLCRRALWLKDGRVQQFGVSEDVTRAYLTYHEEKAAAAKSGMPLQHAMDAGVYAIRAFASSADDVAQGGDVTLRGDVYSPDGRAPVVVIGIVRADGTPVFGVASDMDGIALRKADEHRFEFELTLPALPLQPGKYWVRAHAADPEGLRVFDNVERALTVRGSTRELGLVHLAHRWHDGIDR